MSDSSFGKEVFYIGDTHFGHKKIIEFEREHRPFADIESMNEEIVSRWNATVKPSDKVFHLGDMVLGGKDNLKYVTRLNGRITLIKGNHDVYADAVYIAAGVHKVYSCFKFDDFMLTHIPIHPAQLGYGKRYAGNIHGHLHSRVVDLGSRYLNVSCEMNNLTPISHDDLMIKFKKQVEHETNS